MQSPARQAGTASEARALWCGTAPALLLEIAGFATTRVSGGAMEWGKHMVLIAATGQDSDARAAIESGF